MRLAEKNNTSIDFFNFDRVHDRDYRSSDTFYWSETNDG